MDLREERGQYIAATCKIRFKSGLYYVPSQNRNGVRYTVNPDHDAPTCTCPDFEGREIRCKHIYAVEYKLRVDRNENGTTTVTETMTVEKRTTYPQQWSSYNAAATTEKRWFLSLLADLCAPIPEPERKTLRGRPIPLRDVVYAACFKVFSGASARRFTCNLEYAAERGHISRPVHFNSVLNVFDNEAVGPILSDLIVRSASPLRAVEMEFAVDSTGFSGCRLDRWFDEKWGVAKKRAAWAKAHIICGTRTNVIAAAVMKDGGDTTLAPAA